MKFPKQTSWGSIYYSVVEKSRPDSNNLTFDLHECANPVIKKLPRARRAA
jgi:hypothetical protein